MKYSEVEILIEKSIAERFCTFRRIYNFVVKESKVEVSHDEIQEVIDEMILDRKIAELNNGVVTAYFMSDNVPSKYWLDGDGKIGVEFSKENNMVMGRPQIKFDYEKVEQIVSEVKNDTELAERLKVHRNLIDRRKKEDELFKKAYDIGKAKRAKKTIREILESEPKVFSSPIHAAKSIVDEIIEETEKEPKNAQVKPLEPHTPEPADGAGQGEKSMMSAIPTPSKTAMQIEATETKIQTKTETVKEETKKTLKITELSNEFVIPVTLTKEQFIRLSAIALQDKITLEELIIAKLDETIEWSGEWRYDEIADKVAGLVKEQINPNYHQKALTLDKDLLMTALLTIIKEDGTPRQKERLADSLCSFAIEKIKGK